jgi:hypothetical protein
MLLRMNVSLRIARIRCGVQIILATKAWTNQLRESLKNSHPGTEGAPAAVPG